ncbi:hypothetical protein K0M31_005588 [Melipona bicolor]|uniref:Uncharacterized protein n=1 Tax=Melipona bicolor TaxID=60889 RepID=A0AA40FU87_9HYME|nr:hypothetical protein K0M31_005588 [Melipona bicolor]
MNNEVFRGVFEIRYSNELKENGNQGGARRESQRRDRVACRNEVKRTESFLFFQGWKTDSRNSKKNIGRGTIRGEKPYAETSHRFEEFFKIPRKTPLRGRPEEELEM